MILPVCSSVAWLTLSHFAWLCLLLLCGHPMNWNCQVCGTRNILLSAVDCWQWHSLCVPWLQEKHTCIDDFPLASYFILLLQLSKDLGKSYSFMQKPCVDASLCQPHYPAPKMFMSGSMLAEAYRGLGWVRAAGIWKGGKTKIKQELLERRNEKYDGGKDWRVTVGEM